MLHYPLCIVHQILYLHELLRMRDKILGVTTLGAMCYVANEEPETAYLQHNFLAATSSLWHAAEPTKSRMDEPERQTT